MPPPTASPAIPLDLNLAGALARQHHVGHLHFGLVGLQREVGLGEQLGGGPDALVLQALLEVLRNLKGSDCGQGRGLRLGPDTPRSMLGREQACGFGAGGVQSGPEAGRGQMCTAGLFWVVLSLPRASLLDRSPPCCP